LSWLRSFRIILPSKDKAHLVASRSYLTYSKAELRDKLERNPYSYLHVINPDGQQKIEAKRGSKDFFQWVKKGFQSFQANSWLESPADSTLAIYRQESPHGTCTGIVGLMDLAFVEQGKLKRHEQTLKKRERLFATYLEEVGCNAEPILCAYPEDNLAATQLTAHLAAIKSSRSDYDFSTTDRIRHTVWILKPAQAAQLSSVADGLPALYLADGHHRVASSLELGRRNPEDAHKQGLLTFAIPESELIIRGYHREVVKVERSKDDWSALFNQLKDEFDCEPLQAPFEAPQSNGVLHVHSTHGSWKWTLRAPFDQGIDAGWLNESVLKPFFQIIDARKDPRLKYLPGTLESSQLVARVEKNSDRCIFELHPVLMDQVKDIANNGGTLPPKSTWIEPKLRSGLFIHSFEQ